MPIAPVALPPATHAAGLQAVERELSAMHNELLRTGGEDARMVRLSGLTLVAVCREPEHIETTVATVSRLAQTHPARTIVVYANRQGEDAVDANLSLQATPQGRTGQVLSEQLRLVVRGRPAVHLSSVLTPLLVPDVPVFVWLVGNPPLDQALTHDALEICQRVIIDTDQYDDPVDALMRVHAAGEPAGSTSVADLAWARSRPWRERIAQSFDGPQLGRFVGAITACTLTSAGDRPSAQAWLLAGWLASRLGWREDRMPSLVVEARGNPKPDGGSQQLVGAVLRSHAGAHQAEVSIVRDQDSLVTLIAVDDALSASSTTPVRAIPTVELVGAQVEEPDADLMYPTALAQAVRLAAAAAAPGARP